jgi:hypothetical protein
VNSTRASAVVDAIAQARNDAAMLTSSSTPIHFSPNAVARSFTGDPLSRILPPSDANPTI